MVYDPDKIKNSFKSYYEALYSPPELADEEIINQFLSSLVLPSIGKVTNKDLMAPVTKKELEAAISRPTSVLGAMDFQMNGIRPLRGIWSRCY